MRQHSPENLHLSEGQARLQARLRSDVWTEVKQQLYALLSSENAANKYDNDTCTLTALLRAQSSLAAECGSVRCQLVKALCSAQPIEPRDEQRYNHEMQCWKRRHARHSAKGQYVDVVHVALCAADARHEVTTAWESFLITERTLTATVPDGPYTTDPWHRCDHVKQRRRLLLPPCWDPDPREARIGMRVDVELGALACERLFQATKDDEWYIDQVQRFEAWRQAGRPPRPMAPYMSRE